MSIPANSITLVNHASVLIKGRDCAVLTDPWYSGDAFHKGWKLLHENPEADIDALLAATTHIWVSHEHPDHFSIGFFKKYKARLVERRIPILFQRSKDKRVEGFLLKEGFTTVILKPQDTYTVEPGFTVRIAPDEFYDSALLIDLNGTRIFNLNDCTVHAPARIRAFKKQYGGCDILLTQFSYAAWKGGRENSAWRRDAARDKLISVVDQANGLGAKTVIPFASFVYFSNTLNDYLNDGVNTPATVLDYLQAKQVRFHTRFLRPMESATLDELSNATAPETLAFWRERFANLPAGIPYSTSYTLETLQPLFEKFCARLQQKNSWWLIRLLARLPKLGAFAPLTVQLVDTNERVHIDIPNRSIALSDGPADVSMHSESLAFMFQNSFGYDTLTVNGTFEESGPGGFSKLTKNFAIENLNNLGYSVRPWLAFNLSLIHLCFSRLIAVARKLQPAT